MDRLIEHAKTKMKRSGRIIKLLCEGSSDDQARWRPAKDRWSLAEIINHLYDEEREDFRAAIDIILFHPADPWPQIDPMGWVESRSYNEKSAETLLKDFQRERAASMEWLQSLQDVNWDTPHPGPGGSNPTNAGNTLASWVAHDLVHIHQISDLLRDRVDEDLNPYSGAYAGSLS